MKRIFPIFVLLIFLTACTGIKGKRETVATDGSSSMERVIGYLGEFYMNEMPGVKVTYNPTGSSAGIRAVIEGRCDIGLSSRELKESEISKGLTATLLAIDAIAVIVNKSNPVSELSVDEISAIYKGEIKSWKELGGADNPIVCIGREAASGTREGFETIINAKDKCKYSQELTSAGDIVQTVSSNPNAIGYTSLASVKGNVSIVDVEGISPSKESIQNGSYKIQRNFYMVTKSDTALSDTARGFFDFAVSPSADDLIERAGAIPISR